LVLPLSADVASQDAVTSAESPDEGTSSTALSGDSEAAVDTSGEVGGVATSDAVAESEGTIADAADFDVLGVAANAPNSESSDSAFTPADRFESNIADSAATASAVIVSGNNADSQRGTPELVPPSPTFAHTIVAKARLVQEGTQIDLNYKAARPVVELVLVDGRRIAQSRWVVEEFHTMIPLNKARVAVIGQGTLSDNAIREVLESPRTVVVTPEKSEVLELLSEGTVVVLRNLDHNLVVSKPATVAVTAELVDVNVSSTLGAESDAATTPAISESHAVPATTARAGHGDDVAVEVVDRVADADLSPYVATSELGSGRQPIVLQMDADGNVLVLGQKTPLDRVAAVLTGLIHRQCDLSIDRIAWAWNRLGGRWCA
jgi:hypothetical protein